MSGKNRVFSSEFKAGVAQRILDGESVSALHQEFQIKRTCCTVGAMRTQGGGGGFERPPAGRRESRTHLGELPVRRKPPRGGLRSWNARLANKLWISIFWEEPSSV